ncbi:MAG: phosphonate C-P lyase system protein PhnH [Paracoccus sp. (in: a-proteobacteria)]|nr:phosphonate C-P lyase system protein PhnH [Paracoccus sp. (in: a-proteobacteria)]
MSALATGFTDQAEDSARAFRAILEAMARPGTRQHVAGITPPEGLGIAAAVAVLVLCDRSTPVYLAGGHDSTPIRDWITFQTGARFAAAPEADFAIGAWDALMPLAQYRVGTAEYPDRSATLIVDGGPQTRARLSGPGLQAPIEASLPDPVAMAANAALFPLGVDFILTEGEALTALPRSTRIEVLSCM